MTFQMESCVRWYFNTVFTHTHYLHALIAHCHKIVVRLIFGTKATAENFYGENF